MIIFGWLLATSYLIYRSLKFKSLIIKITTVVVSILIQLALFILCFVGFMFDVKVGFFMSDIILFELLICSLYKIKTISRNERILGLVTMLLISIFAYYFGSVMGPMEYFISDAGGIQIKTPYQFYRWNTYIGDCLYPWTIIFNTLISPYWGRYIQGWYWRNIFKI